MNAEVQQIMQELNFIKKELNDIKESMPDKDMFLTAEESLLLKKSFENEKKGKLKSSKDLRKELGI
jgi:hypothetical protein